MLRGRREEGRDRPWLIRSVPFRAQTKPVVDYYSKQGLYAPVDANQKSDTVKAAIAAILA